MDDNVNKGIKVDEKRNFVGRYFFRVDEKFRVAVPSSFRKIITQESNHTLFLFPGPFKMIFVFTQSGWREFWDCLQRLYNPTRSPFNFQLMQLTQNTWDVSMDSLGRILINEHLREYTGITVGSEVVVMGFNDCFGIATKKVFEESIAKFSVEKIWQDLGVVIKLPREEKDGASSGENPS
jgi:MraZ protein|uniref:Transcriptional regulator MraZ n=1 Tax=candidate division WOR-3 bacterium TaxID=2052148 RepID=A0A7C3YTP8_UNCW3